MKFNRLKRLINIGITTVLLTVTIGQSVAYASFSATGLTSDQYNTILRDSSWHDKTPFTCGAAANNAIGSDVDVTGDNVETAFKYLSSQAVGFTAEQAAGIVGNMMAESGAKIDPTVTNSIGAHGIVQWLGGRLTAMRAWVRAQPAPNNDPETINGQLPFVVHELNTTHASAGAAVRAADTPETAATAFNKKFEVSGDNSGTREKNARTVFNKAQSSGWITAGAGSGAVATPVGDTGDTGSIPAPTSCSGTTSGVSPSCTTATTTPTATTPAVAAISTAPTTPATPAAKGNQAILCAAQKYAGIWYVFGAGPHGNGAYTSFRSKCPLATISTAVAKSTEANPGPCATDCSGLVSAAIDEAYNQTLGWTVATLERNDDGYWQHLSGIDQALPGDVVTMDIHGTPEHVEIVDHIDATASKVYTFGSHHTGTKTGTSSAAFSYYNGGAWRYVGPGVTVAL